MYGRLPGSGGKTSSVKSPPRAEHLEDKSFLHEKDYDPTSQKLSL